MIGVDILEIARMEESLKNKQFINRILTEQEISYVSNLKNATLHITGFYCAKEAVMKALEDCHNLSFKEIEVLHKDSGKPYIKLYGKALCLFEQKGYKEIEISISQSSTVAIAFCQIN